MLPECVRKVHLFVHVTRPPIQVPITLLNSQKNINVNVTRSLKRARYKKSLGQKNAAFNCKKVKKKTWWEPKFEILWVFPYVNFTDQRPQQPPLQNKLRRRQKKVRSSFPFWVWSISCSLVLHCNLCMFRVSKGGVFIFSMFSYEFWLGV